MTVCERKPGSKPKLFGSSLECTRIEQSKVFRRWVFAFPSRPRLGSRVSKTLAHFSAGASLIVTEYPALTAATSKI